MVVGGLNSYVRIAFWGPLYYNYHNDPPNSIGICSGPYNKPWRTSYWTMPGWLHPLSKRAESLGTTGLRSKRGSCRVLHSAPRACARREGAVGCYSVSIECYRAFRKFGVPYCGVLIIRILLCRVLD